MTLVWLSVAILVSAMAWWGLKRRPQQPVPEMEFPGEITELQAQCERRLAELLAELGTTLVDRRILAIRRFVGPEIEPYKIDPYIRGRIDGTELVVFIYVDGQAEIYGGKGRHTFERGDFEKGGLPALWDAFEDAVRKKVAQSQLASRA